jgi:hypothetical protein
MSMTTKVKIERGNYSRYFQVARAWLMAASALVATDKQGASSFVGSAIVELQELRSALEKGH